MDEMLQRQMLAELLPLSTQGAARQQRACKICGGPAPFFDVVDFNKFCSIEDCYAFGRAGIPVNYFRCKECDFLFTGFFDSWTSDDFARWVYNADYPLVDGEYAEIRPLRFAEEMGRRLKGQEAIRILDYGSGTGVFAARMRELGFAAVEIYDPFSAPERPSGRFDLVTCFEVLEHSANPVALLDDMKSFLRPDAGILFSQALQPANIAEIRANWWYTAPRNGHVSTHTLNSLSRLAERAGMLVCGQNGLFMFVGQATNAAAAQLLTNIGPPIVRCRLTAPRPATAGTVNPDGQLQWHAVERSEVGFFRWSAAATLDWALPRAPWYPWDLLAEIPLHMSAYPEVLENARIEVGDQVVPINVVDGRIQARVRVRDPAVRHLRLFTGEPRSPASLRGAPDQRLLGIAVRTGVGLDPSGQH